MTHAQYLEVREATERELSKWQKTINAKIAYGCPCTQTEEDFQGVLSWIRSEIEKLDAALSELNIGYYGVGVLYR